MEDDGENAVRHHLGHVLLRHSLPPPRTQASPPRDPTRHATATASAVPGAARAEGSRRRRGQSGATLADIGSASSGGAARAHRTRQHGPGAPAHVVHIARANLTSPSSIARYAAASLHGLHAPAATEPSPRSDRPSSRTCSAATNLSSVAPTTALSSKVMSPTLRSPEVQISLELLLLLEIIIRNY